MPASSPSPFRHPKTVASIIVGRDAEYEVLRQHLVAVIDGHGGTVLVGGEAGIGKTTLVEAIGREAIERDVLVLAGGCYDLTTTPPYGPWIELADRWPADSSGLQLPSVLRRDDVEDAMASQALLFNEARTFFATAAAAQPVMLILEDLHWADPASLELLRYIARHARLIPLLLVVTYRIDEVSPEHPLFALLPLLVRESGADRVDLRRLRSGDVHDLVSHRYQLSEPDVGRLVSYLLAHTEGNPLYASEVLRTLEEEGMLTATGGEWILGDLDRLVIPRLIRQVTVGRAARRDEATRNLLSIAAVIGQEVSLDIWSAVSDVSYDDLLLTIERAVVASFVTVAEDGLTVRFVHALIREALYDEVLPPRRRVWHRRIAEYLEQTRHASPDVVAYHFQAAGDPRAATWLTRAGEGAERAYAWTTAAARFEAALPLLEVDPAAQRLRGWVLLHLGLLLRYADTARSVDYLEMACRVAREINDRALAALALAHCGVVRNFLWDTQRGVAEMESGIAAQDRLTVSEWVDAFKLQRSLIDPLPMNIEFDDPETIEVAILTSQQAGLLVHLLALVSTRYRDAIALGERYAARIEAVNGDLLLRHTSPLEGASWIDTYAGLGNAYAVIGQVEAARRSYARAEMLYRAAGHHASVVVMAAQHAWLMELPYQADDHSQRAHWLAIAEASEQHTAGIYSAGWSPGMTRLPMLVLEGAWDAARVIAANIIEHQPAMLSILAEVALGTIAWAQGDHAAAWAIVRQRLPNGPASDPTETVAIGAFDLARLAVTLSLDSRDLETARAWLESYDSWVAASGRMLGRTEGSILRAQWQVLSGDLGRAREEAEAALTQARAPRQPLALLTAYRVLGEIATHSRYLEQAEQHLAASLTLAESCGAPFERALTLLSLAEVRAMAGRIDDARRLVEEVHTTCAMLGAVPTSERASAVIARLDSERLTSVFPAGLTAREVDVLRLVAQGLTDAEVAERLFLARRTVNTHLTSIYSKLGVSSRAAATRFAVEHNLA